MTLNEHVWWYLSRASALVAWAALTASCTLGVLLATRVLKPHDRPAWLMALHRHLAAIFVSLTAVHLAGLVADGYVRFGMAELFIPMRSVWKPGAVTVGVVALYAAVAVQGTSLLMRKLPRRLWRAVHLLSYVSFVLVSVHAVWVGSDVRTPLFLVGASAVATTMVLSAVVRMLHLRPARVRP